MITAEVDVEINRPPEETTIYERPRKLGRRGIAKDFRVESTFTFI